MSTQEYDIETINELYAANAALVVALKDILFAVTDDARNNDGAVDVAAIKAVATAALKLTKGD